MIVSTITDWSLFETQNFRLINVTQKLSHSLRSLLSPQHSSAVLAIYDGIIEDIDDHSFLIWDRAWDAFRGLSSISAGAHLTPLYGP